MGIVKQNALVQARMPARLANHPSDYVILLMIALWMRDDTPEPLPVLVSRFIEETPYKRITIVRSLKRLEQEGIIRLQKQMQRYDTGYDISLVDDDILAAIEASPRRRNELSRLEDDLSPSNGIVSTPHSNDHQDHSHTHPARPPDHHDRSNGHQDHSNDHQDRSHTYPARPNDHYGRPTDHQDHPHARPDHQDHANDPVDQSHDLADRSWGDKGGEGRRERRNDPITNNLSPSNPSTSSHTSHQSKNGNSWRIHKLLEKFEAYRSEPDMLPDGYPTPTEHDHALSVDMLTDFDIGVNEQAANVIAEILIPIDIFEQCLRYRAELEAGKVWGQGVLLHRLVHMRAHPPQTALHPERRQNEYFQRYQHHFEEYAAVW